MMSPNSKNIISTIVSLFLMTLSVGCCSDKDTISFKINTKLSPTVRDSNQGWPAVTVELVGVNASEYDTWSNYSMTQYWDPSNPLNVQHDAASNPMMVPPMTLQNGLTQTIEANNPIWQAWKNEGVRYIFVMSTFPRTGDDHPGAADSRRKIIPLQCKRWDSKPEEVTITIKSDGVTFNPAPLPETHKSD